MKTPFAIPTVYSLLKHPDFLDARDANKWRQAYSGGRQFVTQFLKKFSIREDSDDFLNRLDMTYVPRFAKSNLNEVKDAIYQRMPEISRVGGPASYTRAIDGIDGGVDRSGSRMDTFIGQSVLEELCLMGQVGVFIDMPAYVPDTVVTVEKTPRPYLYMYRREQIENWAEDRDAPGELKVVQLCDEVYTEDEDGLPQGTEYRYRRLKLTSQGVVATIIDADGKSIADSVTLKLNKIPFIHYKISESLMADLADYQVALMNLASSDLMYLLKANYPFYVEQVDGKSVNRFVKREEDDEDGVTQTPTARTGVSHGRQYTTDNAPEFIHPSAEPLKASMDKQEQMKQEMRQLLKLKISQTTSTRVSKDSKEMDERTLENGLSAIGLELERGERLIGEVWAQYVGSTPPTIHYPTNYNLKTDLERREEVKELEELTDAVPSVTYVKEIKKLQAHTLLGNRTSRETMEKIRSEVDSAVGSTCSSDKICQQVEAGICDPDTAATILGYPAGTAAKAAKAIEAKAMAVAKAQAAANPTEPNGAQNRNEGDPATNKQGQGARQRGVGK